MEMAEISIGEIAERAKGEVEGDPATLVRGVAGVELAGPHDVCFVTTARYLDALRASRAGAVLLPRSLADRADVGRPVVRVDDPFVVLTWLIPLLHPTPAPVPGVHPSALLGRNVHMGAGVSIGPFAVIGDRVRLGDRVAVGAHSVIEEGCSVGDDTILHSQVTLGRGAEIGRRCEIHPGARVGTEGFRYVFSDGGHRKVPHIGGCRIGDDVEIGSNTTIDRGLIEDTVVGQGTKIDNLVQIGHNVQVGRHAILVSQTGIAGSSTVGDGAILAGQTGVGGHLSIGAGARLGGRAGVTGDVPPGATYSGYPARPHREAMRAQAAFFRLPDLLRRVRELERRLRGEKADTDAPS
jgi:UDP-3-O-[3-hydroxymyristoyl] glucosamine N-acyltransferase